MLNRASVRSAVLLIAGLVLIACSRLDRVALAASPAAGADATTQKVLIKGFKFDPETATVKVGDTVEWTNADSVPHTATAEGAFDSKSIKPGGTWKFVAKKAGSYDYICTFHPNMKAKLVVTE
jgi:plastocyanin